MSRAELYGELMSYRGCANTGWNSDGLIDSGVSIIEDETIHIRIDNLIDNLRVKNEGIAKKIGKLKTSVSMRAIDTVNFQEDPEKKERKIIIQKYMRILELHPDASEYIQQFQKFSKDFDLEELKTELETLEQMYVGEGGDLGELYIGIGKLEEVDPIQEILTRHGINDAMDFLLSKEAQKAPIDTTPRIDGVPLVSTQEYNRKSLLRRSKERIPYLRDRFSRKK